MFVTDIVHCDSDISIGCDTPLTIFQKILRVLSSVRHFFSVARHTIIVCKLSLKEGEDYWVPAVGPQVGGQTKLKIGCVSK
jgi:hypothetical protein